MGVGGVRKIRRAVGVRALAIRVAQLQPCHRRWPRLQRWPLPSRSGPPPRRSVFGLQPLQLRMSSFYAQQRTFIEKLEFLSIISLSGFSTKMHPYY